MNTKTLKNHQKKLDQHDEVTNHVNQGRVAHPLRRMAEVTTRMPKAKRKQVVWDVEAMFDNVPV